MEKFDLTGKLVDCSELIEMEHGEVIFNTVKETCKGVDDHDKGQFENLKTWPGLSLSRFDYVFSLTSIGKNHEIIKPVDVLGVHLMNALKDGAKMVMPGDIIPRFTGCWKFYFDTGKVSTLEVNSYVPGNDGIIAYRAASIEPAKPADITPEGTERIFTSNEPHALPVFMKLVYNPTLIQNYEFVINEWVIQADQHDMSKKWDKAKVLETNISVNKAKEKHGVPPMTNRLMESKILAEKVGTSAQDIIKAGLGHIGDRAATYDKPEGERSMAATVAAFNAVTDGVMDTEEKGWIFMVLLKIVRSQQGNFKLDNYEDGSAYFGLAGEAASKERSKP